MLQVSKTYRLTDKRCQSKQAEQYYDNINTWC